MLTGDLAKFMWYVYILTLALAICVWQQYPDMHSNIYSGTGTYSNICCGKFHVNISSNIKSDMYAMTCPGPSNVALFFAPMVIWEIDNSIHFFQFVAQISDPSNFPEFDLFSLGYPSSTENRICSLWCDTSSSETLRKKAAHIRKQVQKPANSKTVTNPTDNGKGMKPLEHFFLQRSSFLQTSENPQHEQNKIDNYYTNKCIIGGSWVCHDTHLLRNLHILKHNCACRKRSEWQEEHELQNRGSTYLKMILMVTVQYV